jgi:anti-sigma regulatory factor (Ser/Thr protein kinase)
VTVTSVEIEIPSRSVYVGVVRLALASLARSAGVDEATVDDLKIAVSEACANAVLSNEDAGDDAPVTVKWVQTQDKLLVEVGDRGPVHDPGAPDDPFDSWGFSSRSLMSHALLQSLVDDCDIVPRSGGGMCAHLSFKR